MIFAFIRAPSSFEKSCFDVVGNFSFHKNFIRNIEYLLVAFFAFRVHLGATTVTKKSLHKKWGLKKINEFCIHLGAI